MRVAIYARLSKRTDSNAPNIVDQVTRCREMADKRGWTVVEVIEDLGESAYDRDSADDRPGFGRLVALVGSASIDGVLAWRFDRLWRDATEAALFLRDCKRHRVNMVATVQEGDRDPNNPGDEMITTIMASVGRYESSAKSARLKAKALQLAEAGKPSGGPAPYGYTDSSRQTIDPVEAAVIVEAIDRVLDGESTRSICADLNARGVTTKLGTEFRPTNLARIITRPFIAGLRSHHGRIASRATWPAIVSEERFAEVSAFMANPARRKNWTRSEYLLTGGLARCGICDAVLISRPTSAHVRAYVCATDAGGCGKIRRLADPVEAEVVARLWVRVERGEVIDAPRIVDDGTSALIRDLELRLAQLARDHYVDRVIDRPQFLAAQAPLHAELEQAKGRGRAPLGQRLLPVGEWRARWPSASNTERRAMLAMHVEVVRIMPAVRGLNRFDPAKVEVVWRPPAIG